MQTDKLLAQLTSEWFPVVYTRHDDAGTTYPRHCHQDRVSFYVTGWSVSFIFEDGTEKTVAAGERIDVPPKVFHTALVWVSGCDYVVGQISENDA